MKVICDIPFCARDQPGAWARAAAAVGAAVLGQEGGGGVGREAELGIREGAIAQFLLKIE